MQPASQQTSTQPTHHGGGNVIAHHHIEALRGQGFGQVRRQARGEGGHKQSLQKAATDQHPQIVGEYANKASHQHGTDPHCNDGPNRQFVGQYAKRQVGQGNTQHHRRDRKGNRCAAGVEFLL